MTTWANICRLVKYADTSSEINYQTSIKEMVLEVGLGWQPEQITEQLSLALGSTDRLIPDMVVSKDNSNIFIVEMKECSHVKRDKDIAQLISYMKQLETPVGVYIGNEIEVYFKNIGDGSPSIRILSVCFNPNDSNGDEFIQLFSEKDFSIDNIKKYAESVRKKAEFECEVIELLNEIISPDYNIKLQNIMQEHYCNQGLQSDVVAEALKRVSININLHKDTNNTQENQSRENKTQYIFPRKRSGGNQGTAQRYAYGLIKAIIDKNPQYNFQQIYSIFGKKNYIEDLSRIKDPKRWCLSEEDILVLSDGTKIAVSNQWGFNNNSKPKMDFLREIARRYNVDASLPF